MHESTNFSQILSDNKKTNTVTPQFYLSFRKGMPNTTKYSRPRKKAIFCPLERVCLILQNTLDLERRQYFNIKNSKFLV